MSAPDDYSRHYMMQLARETQRSKAKNIKTVMKLIIDRHAFTIPLHFMPDYVTANKRVHDHGILGTPQTDLWAPEHAWLEK